ncbi:hypothetical protein LVD15_18325 [Fulvivirga maritima]|uniref:hypothetical protein n=1 Tax=Fulvivirga maritima TaxID=2904247 RepID=UPI001F4449A5|nr:hypothetical protein [Fulvivirga maritima]UII25251.1 hypothetical protein LVD15_18325 [Fulvivirga maritima]
MEAGEETKNKRAGLIVAALSHAVVLLICLFILAWKAPDPPLPEYGIMVNFGTSNIGSGDVQPTQPVSTSEETEDSAPEPTPETAEEVVEEVSEAEPAETAEPVAQPVSSTPVSTQPSPDVQPVEKETPKKPEVKEEKKVEPKKETTPKPATKPANGADGKDGDNKTPQDANQGNSDGKEGDQGKEEGSLDSRALVGSTWNGSGSSLSMTGWMWDYIPKPSDDSDENGRIVFQVKIDDRGEILQVKTLERSVSPAVEKIYKAEVERLTFSKTADNTNTAPVSTGTITFNIKSK